MKTIFVLFCTIVVIVGGAWLWGMLPEDGHTTMWPDDPPVVAPPPPNVEPPPPPIIDQVPGTPGLPPAPPLLPPQQPLIEKPSGAVGDCVNGQCPVPASQPDTAVGSGVYRRSLLWRRNR